MMTRDEYLLLFEKYLAGEATAQEIAQLLKHKDEFELAEVNDDVATGADILAGQRILEKLNESTGNQPGRRYVINKNWMSIAAAIVVLAAVAIFWKAYFNAPKPQTNIAQNKPHDVSPGGEKAILTLANGKKIVLNDAANGTLAKQGNISISKQKNGIVKYVISGDGNIDNATDAGFNTITTPRGGEYNVVLPDGSAVWLNAASSLRFPTVFKGHERRVELTGEAYFEVAKNKEMPFKVKFKDQEVEVLGTHFNIKAYNDDDDSKTTLLEGSVKISKNSVKQLLAPGEQAVSLAAVPNFVLRRPNLQEVMAWKNGFFIFNETSVQSIMKQAARWYDVDIIYQGDVPNQTFGGRISKYKNISELLKNLELTGSVHFKVEGRRVTVMQ